MDELISVLRGSNAIAVPETPKPDLPKHDGFYAASANSWLKEMQETVRISRARRKGMIHEE